jgi:hypothetical protein
MVGLNSMPAPLRAAACKVLGYWSAKHREANDAEPARRQAAPMPWFVIGFVAMMLFNSLDLVPHADKAYLVQTTTFLLSVALAAMGLETDVRKLRAKGWRPFLVGAGAWTFIFRAEPRPDRNRLRLKDCKQVEAANARLCSGTRLTPFRRRPVARDHRPWKESIAAKAGLRAHMRSPGAGWRLIHSGT